MDPTPTNATATPSLIPEERPKATLADLPTRSVLIVDEPEDRDTPAWMLDSVREWGLFQPIVVTGPHAGDTYHVGEGRKRTRAARAVGLDAIPAQVFPPGTPLAVLALAGNCLRQRSPASELAQAESLVKSGHDKASIAAQLHIQPAVVDKLLALRGLRSELRAALDSGKLAPGPAYAAAKLGESRQLALASILAAKGRITGTDVREARTAGVQDAQGSLADLALPPGVTDAAARPASPQAVWRDIRAHADAIARLLPESVEEWVRKAVEGVRTRADLGAAQPLRPGIDFTPFPPEQGEPDRGEDIPDEDEEEETDEPANPDSIVPVNKGTSTGPAWLAVECGNCRAKAGEPCKSVGGNTLPYGHAPRTKLAGERAKVLDGSDAYSNRIVACKICEAPPMSPCRRPSGHGVFGGAVHAEREVSAAAQAARWRAEGNAPEPESEASWRARRAAELQGLSMPRLREIAQHHPLYYQRTAHVMSPTKALVIQAIIDSEAEATFGTPPTEPEADQITLTGT